MDGVDEPLVDEETADGVDSGPDGLLTVAHAAAEQQDYETAIAIFEQLAESDSLRARGREGLFKAALCHLCLDAQSAEQALERYATTCPAFGATRECRLLQTIVAAAAEQDVDAFTQSLVDYDAACRLDSWTTALLLRVKRRMEDGAEDEGATVF